MSKKSRTLNCFIPIQVSGGLKIEVIKLVIINVFNATGLTLQKHEEVSADFTPRKCLFGFMHR